MTLALILASLALTPPDSQTGVASDSVYLIELNHYYDDEAHHVFDQLIFYDWSTDENRFQVRAWRLLKSDSQLPQRNWTSGGYDVIWHDGEVMRHVQARAFKESWTQYDPEMRERTIHPKNLRRGLTTPRLEIEREE